MSHTTYNYETLVVTTPSEYVYQVELNRPAKLNAMNKAFWRELREFFGTVSTDSDCRVVVLTGAGRAFTAGMDLAEFFTLSDLHEDTARRAFQSKNIILQYQATFTAIEKCPKPVIAAVHGACVGGGVDMITACDMRLCSKGAWFQVKEVDLGVAADVGTLQRLPKVVGNDSWARELCYTARRVESDEAKEFGLISKIYPDRESLLKAAFELASTIAGKSPVAVQGTKVNLVYSRDHSVEDSLNYIAAWNMNMLQTEDMKNAMKANMTKKKAVFSKL
ncbi:delta(3,5)-Delta(2,4)-dienoyl-CoA isomerase, mitochondrial-like [Ptychodera flava]|uniref:delta(3,5)-Delta(2,4)-dienoyl-CoA isomerase, mitochondrial-like n=1 Tax=Ptychodera flava TaxID=63121 RepID=UPI00396A2953